MGDDEKLKQLGGQEPLCLWRLQHDVHYVVAIKSPLVAEDFLRAEIVGLTVEDESDVVLMLARKRECRFLHILLAVMAFA